MKGLKNNTLGAVWKWFVEHISLRYNELEARAIGRLVFEHYLNISATDFALNRDIRISESKILELWRVIKKLNNNVPVQYITGRAYFRDLVLDVNKHVLIPRSETEELVQWVMDGAEELIPNPSRTLHCWDIGTGSGAIAISIAKELKGSKVFASDVSEKALEVARKNAELNQTSVHFFLHDILKDPIPEQRFDCIVSNPPYVRESEKALMQKNVLDYEPHQALFVNDNDPLLYYSSIVSAAKATLNPSGVLYVEINEALGRETAELFEQNGFSAVEIRKDMRGKERFVRGRF
jgi:release factor glutamine methyltransferase